MIWRVESKPCEVERDGVWWPGELLRWRRDRTGWRALVLYTVGPGMRHLHEVPAERVKQPL